MKTPLTIAQTLFVLVLAATFTLSACSDNDNNENYGKGEGTVTVEDSTYILDQGLRTFYDNGDGLYVHNIMLHSSSLNNPDENGYYLHFYFFTNSETLNGQTLEYTHPNENIPNTIYFAFLKLGFDSDNQTYEQGYDLKDGSLTVSKEGGNYISFDFITTKMDSAGNVLAHDISMYRNYSGSLTFETF
ncbi:MAG TPA: hypothetical protein VJ937_03735 [Salinivirga sp.]|uniref:hypothetical protein n=1 Tax=Salinivirga sp. TaxID=1970192 RepID=UPI002B486F3C|nr:hypothetical protein [Salinivirga sp.]HKK58562.1 hypothetical protein [Salinivirga sp.]